MSLYLYIEARNRKKPFGGKEFWVLGASAWESRQYSCVFLSGNWICAEHGKASRREIIVIDQQVEWGGVGRWQALEGADEFAVVSPDGCEVGLIPDREVFDAVMEAIKPKSP